MESKASFIDADIAHRCKSCRRKEDVAMFLDDDCHWTYFEDDGDKCPTCGGVLLIED